MPKERIVNITNLNNDAVMIEYVTKAADSVNDELTVKMLSVNSDYSQAYPQLVSSFF